MRSLTFLPNECDYEPLKSLVLRHDDVSQVEDPLVVLLDRLRSADCGTAVKLWEHPSGIYKVYYLLVDGIMCSITLAKDQVQKSIGESVMSILTLLFEVQRKSKT